MYACKNEPGAENADQPVFSDEPFFAVELKNTKLPFPALPMNTKIMPYDLMLVQPALKPSKEYEKDGLVGTSAWMSVLPTYTGKIKLGYVKGLLPGGKLSNGVDFPDIRPWSTVIYWPSCDIVFPPAHVLMAASCLFISSSRTGVLIDSDGRRCPNRQEASDRLCSSFWGLALRWHRDLLQRPLVTLCLLSVA